MVHTSSHTWPLIEPFAPSADGFGVGEGVGVGRKLQPLISTLTVSTTSVRPRK
jgi:hypothetical protein